MATTKKTKPAAPDVTVPPAGEQNPGDSVDSRTEAPTGPVTPMSGKSVLDASDAAPGPVPLQRLEHARALLELAVDEPAVQVTAGIQAFKDEDRRTMAVVVSDGRLYKQEVRHG